LETTAACLKGFYLYQGSRGVHQELAEEFKRSRLPTKADRRRAFLGHTLTEMPANPLTTGKTVRRRHPKMPPEGARSQLIETLPTARDRMVVTWLADGGFRIGELCGLHLIDLHLREGAACGDCRSPHVHICHRETNPNRARVKTKQPWVLDAGTVRGGTIRRASPAMIHTYFEYLTTEYPRSAEHGMLLLLSDNGLGPALPVCPRPIVAKLLAASATSAAEQMRRNVVTRRTRLLIVRVDQLIGHPTEKPAILTSRHSISRPAGFTEVVLHLGVTSIRLELGHSGEGATSLVSSLLPDHCRTGIRCGASGR
jgi:hypothetical protein